jgi:phage terminase small subunit
MNKNPKELFEKLKSLGLAEEISPYLIKGIDAYTEKDDFGAYEAREKLKKFVGDKLIVLEKSISNEAKGGMRSYAKEELIAYEQNRVLLDLFESTGAKQETVGQMREYWLLHGPTQHKTIKESKPFDPKSENTEVLDKVIEKFSQGQNNDEDRRFLEEIDKRLGKKMYIEWVENLKIGKSAIDNVKPNAETKIAQAEADYQSKLKELDALKFNTEQKAGARQVKMRLVWGIVALCVVTLVAKIFSIGAGLFVLGIFAVIFYAFKDR